MSSPALSIAEAADHAQLCVANPYPEEPYALIALVRFCGGFGRATSHLYPEHTKGYETARGRAEDGPASRCWIHLRSITEGCRSYVIPRKGIGIFDRPE